MVFGHPDRQRSSMADAEIDPATIPGVESRHPWRHPWRAWRAIFKRIYVMNGYHNLSLMAAGVAFYAFLSFVPLLGAVVMTYGLVADPATVAQPMQAIIELVPSDAAALIQDQLVRSEEHTSELVTNAHLVCLLLTEQNN